MNNKICMFRQPAGLGDIFFLQKAAYKYHEIGYDIIWPILDNFLFLKDYITTPYIKFYSEKEDFPFKEVYISNPNECVGYDDNFLYIPFQHADRIHPEEKLLHSKYKLIDLDCSDWASYFKFERNLTRENKLYYDILKLSDDTKYNFINSNYGSFPNSVVHPDVHSKENEDILTITMDKIDTDDYSDNVFDWLKVIENASNIYSVDTSIMYLMESISLKADNLELWSRFGSHKFDHITGLYAKKYNYN